MKLSHDKLVGYYWLSIKWLVVLMILALIDEFYFEELLAPYLKVIASIVLLILCLALFGSGFFKPKDKEE